MARCNSTTQVVELWLGLVCRTVAVSMRPGPNGSSCSVTFLSPVGTHSYQQSHCCPPHTKLSTNAQLHTANSPPTNSPPTNTSFPSPPIAVSDLQPNCNGRTSGHSLGTFIAIILGSCCSDCVAYHSSP